MPKLLPPLNGVGDHDPEGIRSSVSRSVIIQGSATDNQLLKVEGGGDSQEPEIKITDNNNHANNSPIKKEED